MVRCWLRQGKTTRDYVILVTFVEGTLILPMSSNSMMDDDVWFYLCHVTSLRYCYGVFTLDETETDTNNCTEKITIDVNVTAPRSLVLWAQNPFSIVNYMVHQCPLEPSRCSYHSVCMFVSFSLCQCKHTIRLFVLMVIISEQHWYFYVLTFVWASV